MRPVCNREMWVRPPPTILKFLIMTNVTLTPKLKPTIIKGDELVSVPRGTFLKLVRYEGDAVSSTHINSIVIRTNNSNNPFVTVHDTKNGKGGLWGTSLEGYVFEVITEIEIIEK